MHVRLARACVLGLALVAARGALCQQPQQQGQQQPPARLKVHIVLDVSKDGLSQRQTVARRFVDALLAARRRVPPDLPELECAFTPFSDKLGATRAPTPCESLVAQHLTQEKYSGQDQFLSDMTALVEDLVSRSDVARSTSRLPEQPREVTVVISDFRHEAPASADVQKRPSEPQAHRVHWEAWLRANDMALARLRHEAQFAPMLLLRVPEQRSRPDDALADAVLSAFQPEGDANVRHRIVRTDTDVSQAHLWLLEALRPVRLEPRLAPPGCDALQIEKSKAWFDLPLGSLAWPPPGTPRAADSCVIVECRDGAALAAPNCQAQTRVQGWQPVAPPGCPAAGDALSGWGTLVIGTPQLACRSEDFVLTLVIAGHRVSRPAAMRPRFILGTPRLLLFPGGGHQAELQQDISGMTSVNVATRLIVGVYAVPRGAAHPHGERPMVPRQLGEEQCYRVPPGLQQDTVRITTLVHQDDLQDDLPAEIVTGVHEESSLPVARLVAERWQSSSEFNYSKPAKVTTCFHPRFKTLARGLVISGLLLGGVALSIQRCFKLDLLGAVPYIVLGPLLVVCIPASSVTSDFFVDLLLSMERVPIVGYVWCGLTNTMAVYKWHGWAKRIRWAGFGFLVGMAVIWLGWLGFALFRKRGERPRRQWEDRPWRGPEGRRGLGILLFVVGITAGAHSVWYAETNGDRHTDPFCDVSDTDRQGTEDVGPPVCQPAPEPPKSDPGELEPVEMGCPR